MAKRNLKTIVFYSIKKKISYVIFLFGMLSLIRTIILLSNVYLPDYEVLYKSSYVMNQHGNPYVNSNLFTQVNYLPILLFILSPLLIFPFYVSSKIWIVISVLSFLFTLIMLYKIKPLSSMTMSIIFLATTVSFPLKFTIGMGQINLILLFMLVLFLFFLKKKKELVSSIFLSFAIITKLFPLIFIINLIYSKKIMTLLICLGLIIFLFFLPEIILKKGINTYYIQYVLVPLVSKPVGAVYYNQSITGFMSRIDASTLVTLISRVVIILISLFFSFKTRKDILTSFSIILLMILLVNSFTWQHHLILLLLPYYILLTKKHTKKLNLILIFSYLLIAFNIKEPANFSNMWYGGLILSHGFFGVLLLWLGFISTSVDAKKN